MSISIGTRSLAVLAAASALVVAACGSTKDSTENEPAKTPAATQENTSGGGGEIKPGLKIAFLP